MKLSKFSHIISDEERTYLIDILAALIAQYQHDPGNPRTHLSEDKIIPLTLGLTPAQFDTLEELIFDAINSTSESLGKYDVFPSDKKELVFKAFMLEKLNFDYEKYYRFFHPGPATATFGTGTPG